MSWLVPFGIGLGALLMAFGGSRALLPVLRRRGLLDRPNERSSHRVPTPRGGGLAVVPAALLGWLAVALLPARGADVLWLPIAGGLALAAVSFVEDVRGLGVPLRLGLHGAAVALGLQALAPEALVFQGALPLFLDRLLAGLLWLWFVNLYNFMDGIDGITAVETGALALGLGLVALAALAVPPALGLCALALGAAALGFLPLNWPPARLFLGDVGSVPIGYLSGFLLLWLAAEGAWQAALILPAYYLADSGTTLAQRLVRGQRVWRAHREHAYQRAVANGLSHGAVSLRIGLADLGLVGLALASLAGRGAAWAALAGAAVLALSLLWYLRRPGAHARDVR